MKTFYMYVYSKTIETYQNIVYVWLLQSCFTAVSCNKIGVSSLKMAITPKHVGAN